ncbi:MAG: hypothetical protein HY648_10360 [Acidobacteria bacterium]|nr:hypothetical protein [Acidobacteriota bacterium]
MPGDRTEPRLGIVAALRWEVRPLLSKAHPATNSRGRIYLLNLGQDSVVLAIGGMGAENAFRAAGMLTENFRLRGLLTLGFAGGLADALAAGDVVLADRVVDLTSGEQFTCRSDLLPVQHAHCGALLCSNRVVASATEKRRLGLDYSAVAVDMESAGVARAAVLAGLPFGALKAITDDARQSIPIDCQGCQSENGTLSILRLFHKGLQSWLGMRDLWALGLGARLAARNLLASLDLA